MTGRVILVCSGSRPKIPEIVGLRDARYLTTDALFDLDEIGAPMTFIGGGLVAVELAQACHRLGVAVTVLESAAGILGREERELVEPLMAVLARRSSSSLGACSLGDDHGSRTRARRLECRTSRRRARGATRPVHRWSLAHNDRASTDATEGGIVLVERVRFGRRRLVGAHILAPGAAELIGELALAIHQRLSVSNLGGMIDVYPTIATSIQQLGSRAALDQALKYRWSMRIMGRR